LLQRAPARDDALERGDQVAPVQRLLDLLKCLAHPMQIQRPALSAEDSRGVVEILGAPPRAPSW